ncbi:uncharacterized protein LOC123980141 isoform X1 [Micropterus dolomieu]|uniref:uncharacterized protein LOC123980141 isoform X1 n=1 Tax=Micropterus dolomieu TaxID=147949 RepID=UPI001E8DAAD1|nr:uncharacterized protein LOC123980141 isoform X1 [Micropterus dolomieu]
MVVQILICGFRGEQKVINLCDTKEQIKSITGRQLKEKIIQQTDFSVYVPDILSTNVRLIFCNKILDDDSLLSEYGIQHTSVIYMMRSYPGGGTYPGKGDGGMGDKDGKNRKLKRRAWQGQAGEDRLLGAGGASAAGSALTRGSVFRNQPRLKRETQISSPRRIVEYSLKTSVEPQQAVSQKTLCSAGSLVFPLFPVRQQPPCASLSTGAGREPLPRPPDPPAQPLLNKLCTVFPTHRLYLGGPPR